MVQVRKATTNEPRERQMRSEYIAKYLMGKDWHTEYPLGNVIALSEMQNYTDAQLRALTVRKARADLVVAYPDRLDIYEFQIIPRWSKFGQLLAYLELARQTDSLAAFKTLQIRGILVSAVEDPFIRVLCEKYGLQYEIYTPDWTPLYFETLRPRDYTPIQVTPP
jgi:hypothetical protein